jgi:hypothetical protein
MNTTRQHDELSEAQKRRLSATCGYIDKLLCEIEQILDQSSSKSPFPHSIMDVTPAQARVLEEHISRIREQLLHALGRESIRRETPGASASHSILTRLEFIDNAIEELKPRHMRGYGAISADVAERLNGTVDEFRSAVQGMGRYLRQESGVNFKPGDHAPEKANRNIPEERTEALGLEDKHGG